MNNKPFLSPNYQHKKRLSDSKKSKPELRDDDLGSINLIIIGRDPTNRIVKYKEN